MSIRIQLGNTKYFSLEEASKSLNLKSSSGLKNAIYAGKTEYHGLPLKVLRSIKKTDGVKYCPVYCETLKRKFKTITLAAQFAGVNDWTMSKKMTTSGQFIDDKGNVYRRLKPMNSKNTYENTGSTMKIKMPKNIKRNKVEEKMDLFDYMKEEPKVTEPVMEKAVSVKSTSVNEIDKETIAKEVLREKMKAMLDTENMQELKTILSVYEMM